ncbi:uncharacterized protein UDID_17239 [Ustilago sp. UG-2017a]|nr:uncharacterized protein UDID_17239 [Ustilago sp. UG-2017a]
MVVVQSPWRPWTPTDSHAKEERAHMRGGPATKRTKLKEQVQPQRGPSSRSMQMVTTQGLERQEPKEPSLVKGKEQCIGNRQVGPEEEEQCRRSRHSSGGQEWCVRGRAPETQVGLSRYSVTIQLCDSYCLGIGL